MTTTRCRRARGWSWALPAFVALSLMITGCSGASGASTAKKALTPEALSTKIGCVRLPGDGNPDSLPGTTDYHCNPDGAQAAGSGAYIGLAFFASPGAKSAWISRQKNLRSGWVSAPPSDVVGNNWAVWGWDQAVIEAAVNVGGSQLD